VKSTRLRTWLIIGMALAVAGTWIGRNTYWDELKIPMPPKGEALINPFYAAQRFAEALGARTSWDRTLTIPRQDAVIVLSGWHWSVGQTRRAAIQQWVESGGRLVVDSTLVDPSGEFEEWAGLYQEYPQEEGKMAAQPECRPLREQAREQPDPAANHDALSMCHIGISWLESTREPEWALRDKSHIQVARMRIGRGSVTVINAVPFQVRALFDGDHGRIFVAATELRRGDELHFLSEDDYPSLLALTWRHGAPAVAVGLALVAILLWRGAIRFGPLAPPVSFARRSLADQIRGSGRFALQHGGDQALHAACVRALDVAARRRISRYAALSPEERSAALARVTGFDRDSLAAAIHHPRWRTAGELHRTLAFLEAARRETLTRHQSR
jgi:hypothetical protein